jgi:hypothetical protein
MAEFTAAQADEAHHFGLGLDDSAPASSDFEPAAGNAPWLMIPRDDDAFFRLKDGAGLTLQGSMQSRGIILMEEEGGPNAQNSQLRSIKIRGLSPGNGVIEARQGGSVVARLRYSVFEQVQCLTRFFTVRDKGGHWSRRPTTEAKAMVDLANKLFKPQANVSFYFDGPWLDAVETVLPDVLPDIRSMQSPGTPLYYWGPQQLSGPLPATASPDYVVWSAIFKPAIQDRRVFNVFFVWKTDDFNTPAATLGNCMFMQDGIARQGHVFAHEAGHFCLGSDWHPKSGGHSFGPHDLMQQTRRDDFIKIPMDQAFEMQSRFKLLSAIFGP